METHARTYPHRLTSPNPPSWICQDPYTVCGHANFPGHCIAGQSVMHRFTERDRLRLASVIEKENNLPPRLLARHHFDAGRQLRAEHNACCRRNAGGEMIVESGPLRLCANVDYVALAKLIHRYGSLAGIVTLAISGKHTCSLRRENIEPDSGGITYSIHHDFLVLRGLRIVIVDRNPGKLGKRTRQRLRGENVMLVLGT